MTGPRNTPDRDGSSNQSEVWRETSEEDIVMADVKDLQQGKEKSAGRLGDHYYYTEPPVV